MNNKSIIQSILYTVGSEGIELSSIKKVLDISINDIRQTLKEMGTEMANDPNCGLCIKAFGDKYYLLTKESNHEYLAKLVNIKTRNPLTPALLETLAIIAYNQPCTRQKIEEIRNTDPTFAVDRLIELGLIANTGKADTPGNPYLYEVTQKFFELFGIKSIKDLPPIEDANFNLSDDDMNFFDSSR
ncbi:MAG: SMC-Scp complex subunit ScpB [Mycoplasmoidaceae bacterium]|nr:SMC-Scp complex subunit ScpB [Mycoplasmoidaceae bacterium]